MISQSPHQISSHSLKGHTLCSLDITFDFFMRIIVNNMWNIYRIHTKLGMGIPFYILFICTKFQGN